MKYQINLTAEQEHSVLHYVRNYHHDYIRKLLILAGLSAFGLMGILRYPDSNLKSYVIAWEIFLVCSLCFLIGFVRGIGIVFGIHSDYDCLEHGQYTIDFRQSAGKLPERNQQYYVSDSSGNQYRCLRFLDYRNAEQGRELLCIHLANGRHYALLESEEFP